MKTLAFANSKGGVGKTTVCVNFAIRAAMGMIPQVKKKILVLDMDQQQNCSKSLLQMRDIPGQGLLPPIHDDYDPIEDDDWDGTSSSTDIYFDTPVFPYETNFERLHVLPSRVDHLQLFEDVTKLAREDNTDLLEKICEHFVAFLSLDDVHEEYDLILFDTPPGKSFITMPVLRAASHVVIPSSMGQYDIDGVYEMFNVLRTENTYRGTDIKVAGIVPNKYKVCNKHREALAALRASPEVGKYVFDSVLSDREAFIFDNLPVRGGSVRFTNKKAEKEMDATVKSIVDGVWSERPIEFEADVDAEVIMV